LARLSQRADPARVERELLRRGLTADSARELLLQAQDAVCSVRRRRGALHMLGGGALLLGAIAATVFSYLRAADAPEGGTCYIGWGAVLAGVTYFFTGFALFRRARPEAVRRRAGPARA
jgi:hypothetical protein